MAFMEWRQDLNINVADIDNQHKNLFQLVNKLHMAVLNRKGREILEEVLNELVDYTQKHFTLEEELMQTHEYNELAAHKKEHEDLKKRVLEFVRLFNNGNDSICTELLLFLEDWLLIHISNTDKNFGAFWNKIHCNTV